MPQKNTQTKEKNKKSNTSLNEDDSDSSSQEKKVTLDDDTPSTDHKLASSPSPTKEVNSKNKGTEKNLFLVAKPTTKSKDLYNPSKSKYHPIEDASWKRGEK